MSKTLTNEEWEDLKYSAVQFKNMSTIHDEYKEEKEIEIDRLTDRIKKLETTLESERQDHKEELDKLTTNMGLMGGEDLTGTNLSKEQKYFQKCRYVMGKIRKSKTSISNKGYKDTLISINRQVRAFTKGKRSHWISSKQEAVIDSFISKNPPQKDEHLWENGKPYKKRVKGF